MAADREIVIRIVAEATQAEANLRVIEDRIKALTREFSAGTIAQDKYEKELKDLSQGAAIAKENIKQLDDQVKKHNVTTDKQAANSDKLIGLVQRYAGPAVLGLAIKQTIAWADNLSDLADQTGISVTNLQKLERAAAANGKTLTTVTDAVFQLSKRLGDGDKSAVAAVKALGMKLEDVMRLAPADAFVKLGLAVTRVDDPMRRAAISADLFGRGAKELNGVLQSLDDSLTQLPTASEGAVRALGRLSDGFGAAYITGKALLTEVLGRMAGLMGSGFGGGNALAVMVGGASSAGFNWGQQLARNWLGIPSAPAGPGMPSGGGIAAPGLPADLQQILGQPIRGGGGQVVAVPNGRGGVTYRPMTEADRQQYLSSLPLLTGFMGGQTPQGGISGLLPSMTLPGGGMALLAPGLSSGFTSTQQPGFLSRMGGSLFSALPQTLMSAFTGGGNITRSIGGLAGGAIGSAMSTAGTFLGNVLPGVGTLLGGLLPSLFSSPMFGGPTAKAREDAAVQPQINALIAQVTELYGGLGNVKTMGDIVGVSLAEAFGSKGKAGLEHLTKLAAQFQTQTEKLQAALEKYGLTWEDLGQKAKEFFFLQDAQSLLDDFKLLELAGVETTKLLEKMAGSFNALVQTAITNGLTIPNSMRPMLDQLLQMGLLLDAAGNQLERIDDLFKGLDPPDPLTIDLNYRPPQRPDETEQPESVPYMRGGLVGTAGLAYAARGGFMRGTDAVLAALTPGEFVMSREAVKRVGRGTLHAINRGAGMGGGAAVVVNVDARESVFDGTSAARFADKIGEHLMQRASIRGVRFSGVGA